MKKYFVFNVKDIVEVAMLVAAAVVLDLPGLKFKIGPNGGSISLSLVPLIVMALRKGTFKSFIGIGIIYGVITCAIDGWGFHTYPFDYLLAYGSFSLIGLFRIQVFPPNSCKYSFKSTLFLIISILFSTLLRLGFSTISGMIFYQLNFVSSLAYNCLYVLPSSGVAIVFLLILYKPLISINKTFPTI